MTLEKKTGRSRAAKTGYAGIDYSLGQSNFDAGFADGSIRVESFDPVAHTFACWACHSTGTQSKVIERESKR